MKDSIKEMANLLRLGHTMLNIACPICNNPIFRDNKGEMFCPACKRKVIYEKETENLNNTQKAALNIEKKEEDQNDSKNQESLLFESLRSIITEKMNLICQNLKNETQIEFIARYVHLLTNFFDLLERISRFNKESV